ncbi:helix-turn-helix transcriptional regulator [Hydrogenimonas thermophila]|uniref:helix-turn-helix domain-containing protein n=1 Tax=Hydrogenimonas thermophila TaxID=223786 RepID=UPI002937223F|nr:helix-turn-helix transcriptional regulator [Hydrogenimonas thermophila]WOE69110.1 helix-turn-helix transcriptional regulator [Hydrogenimonas thermophila]WOE71620.1 helix-turn-helix transcriptional regulator [Hydrogenimonas thermophila]
MQENIVKKVCKELGITQKELAERLGVSADTISNWAKGKTKTPKWALELFRLMKLESEIKEKNQKLDEIINIAKSLKSE